MARFIPSPNITSGDTQSSGSNHQITGSLYLTGSLTLDGIVSGAVASNNHYLGLGAGNVVVRTSATGGGGGGSGDVTGPGSATDNAIARYNGTTGKTLQNSGVTIDDSNNASGIANLTTTGRAIIGNAASDQHSVSGTLDINGQFLNLRDTALRVSASAEKKYTVGSDNYYTLLSFYNLDKDTHLSGVVYNETQDRVELRNFGDDTGYKSFAADSFLASGDLQFIGGNMTVSDGNIQTGGSLSIAGQNTTLAAEENTTLFLKAGYKEGSTGIVRIIDNNNEDDPQGRDWVHLSNTGSVFWRGITAASGGIEPRGAGGADTIQVGTNNGAIAIGSLNISFGGTVSGQGSQAIGPGAPRADGAGATSFGSGSNALATNALAIGTQATASALSAVAIGSNATGSAIHTLSIGNLSVASGRGALALGHTATSSADGALVIGSGSTSAGPFSVVMGDSITNLHYSNVTVLGSRASAAGNNSVAIGSGSSAASTNAIAIGESATPSAGDAIGIGTAVISSATGSVVVGASSIASGQKSVVLGPTNNSTANYTTIIGYNNTASVNYSIVIGDTSVGSSANAIAIGQSVTSTGTDSIAIGKNAQALSTNSIAIGRNSEAGRTHTVVYGSSMDPMRLYVSGGMAQTLSGSGSTNPIPTVVAGNHALDCGTYNIFKIQYSAATQLTASNLIAGASYLIFLSNSVGDVNVSYDSNTFKFPAGTPPSASTTQGQTDILSGISDGISLYADMTKNFS
jgi:hypothetical protein